MEGTPYLGMFSTYMGWYKNSILTVAVITIQTAFTGETNIKSGDESNKSLTQLLRTSSRQI
jgi:hypothetical protein